MLENKTLKTCFSFRNKRRKNIFLHRWVYFYRCIPVCLLLWRLNLTKTFSN